MSYVPCGKCHCVGDGNSHKVVTSKEVGQPIAPLGEITMGKISRNRRGFLKFAGLTGLGLGAGLTGKIASAQTKPTNPGDGMGSMPGMERTPQATTAARAISNEELDWL